MKKFVITALTLGFAFTPAFAFADVNGYLGDCNPPNSCQSGLDCNFSTNQCDCPAGLTWSSTDATCEAFAATQDAQTPGATTVTTSNGAGLNLSGLKGFADSITQFINDVLVPLLVAVAFIVFIYGVFNYFIKGGADEEAHKTGRTFILYGIIGFVVILSVWGLVNIGRQLLNFGPQSQTSHPAYPRL